MRMWPAALLLVVFACFAPVAAAQGPCKNVTNARDWRNPYIVVRARDLAVTVQGVLHEIAVDKLADYLKQLPSEAWPCGKVVGVQEVGPRAPNDGPAIKENWDKVNRILKELDVKADWWPSA